MVLLCSNMDPQKSIYCFSEFITEKIGKNSLIGHLDPKTIIKASVKTGSALQLLCQNLVPLRNILSGSVSLFCHWNVSCLFST